MTYLPKLLAGCLVLLSVQFAQAVVPWDMKLLSQPPKFRWNNETEPVRPLLYTGENYKGKPTKVFAYYASPLTLGTGKAGEKYPAMVLVHGGGGTAFREWAELWAKRGYAAIAMDLAGCRPVEGKNAHDRANRARLENGGPGQDDHEKFGSVMKEPGEQWPYHAVANVILAHSLIRSFPEVNADKTGVTGISWGGYLTCIVAGVDQRFKAAVPVYGCGYLLENSKWVDQLNRMKPEERERWVKLWDPKHYLPKVEAPILFVNGTNDAAYPLDSYMASYDAVPGEKQIRVTINMPHGHPPGWEPEEIGIFIDHWLLKKKPLPRFDTKTFISADGKLVVTSCEPSTFKIISAELNYPTNAGPINKRTWRSVAATIKDDRITAPVPPESADMYFFTVTDERMVTVSTPIEFPKLPIREVK